MRGSRVRCIPQPRFGLLQKLFDLFIGENPGALALASRSLKTGRDE